jgi:O-antigen/teichoic acid export membrane protein
MSILILPPAATIWLLPEAILTAWIGDSVIAAGAAPVLSVLAVGTALMACSYPPLSVLYSRKTLRPVVILQLAMAVTVLPIMVAVVIRIAPLAQRTAGWSTGWACTSRTRRSCFGRGLVPV